MGKFKSIGSLLGIGGGGGIFSQISQLARKPPSSLPKRTDPEIEQERKRQQAAEKLRGGRRATILTSRRGVEGQLGSVSRPQARAAQLLGE